MADHEHDRPGEPPEIRDEAADSPMWLPVLGLTLLLLGAVFLVWRSSGDDVGETETTEEAAPEAEAAGDAPAPSEEAPE